MYFFNTHFLNLHPVQKKVIFGCFYFFKRLFKNTYTLFLHYLTKKSLVDFFCGGVFVVAFCGGVFSWFCVGRAVVFVVVLLCFCCGVVLFWWWCFCSCVFVVLCFFVVVWLRCCGGVVACFLGVFL